MEKPCEYFEDMLVGHADEQLPPDDASQVAEHLSGCERCRLLLDSLRKSLDLVDAIWADGITEMDEITIPRSCGARRLRWPGYVAVAASIVVVAAASVLWFVLTGPGKAEQTVAAIERDILESANAARLLAATEILAKHPDTQPFADQQYRYITETYPGTTAANEAKLKIQ